ncbi:MAG: hypothetical protein GF383_00895 [Candidatus Lokiarchaeota archaeon]|nr:hypothetical protein [Candidatus Lokiarchaeota archaeon]MBD3337742.1 hypothetical protein [Candidatus Lokiarchaeota archaeon]
MSENRDEYIYDRRIRKYEELIIDFVVKGGKNKRRSERESHIIGYLITHEKLTQKQIRDLSLLYYQEGARKGISRGSISNILNYNLDLGMIKRSKVPGKKKKFEYQLRGSFLDYISSLGKNLTLNLFKEEMSFYRSIKTQLERIRPQEIDNSELFKLLINRTNELIEYLEFLETLLMKSLYSNVPESKASKSDYNVRKLYKKETSSYGGTSMLDLEKKIVTYILNSPFFIIEKESYAPVMAYLITRRVLTQSELQTLTGISSGLISEALNFFLNEGYIRAFKKDDISDRQIYYSLDSIAIFNLSRYQKRLQIILDFKPEVNRILNELKSREGELKNLAGYTRIRNYISEFKSVIPLIEKFDQIFADEISQFEEKIAKENSSDKK